ncbi:MAG: hypothetical protein JXQ73_19485 [Phycisphaerae bacterium]|nr:hypothetical protein [Phycisphaerae bacterium]
MTPLGRDSLVPEEIQRKLSGVLWRARLVWLVRGLAVLSGTLAASVLAAIAADHFLMGYVERYVILYEWPVRLAVTSFILVVGIVVAVVFVARPLLRGFSDAGIALSIEQGHPELEERLSSTVELLASDDPEVVRGSNEMLRLLTEQARTGARALSLRGMIRWRRTGRYWAVTGVVLLVGAAIGLRWPEPFQRSLKRLFLANLGRVGETKVAVLGEGDRVVPESEPVMIRAEVKGRSPQSVWLLVRDEVNHLQTLEMASMASQSGIHTCTILATHGTWHYQIRAGDSHTKWYDLKAVPRPDVTGVAATIRPPPYSGKEIRRIGQLSESVKVLRHSEVALTIRTNAPVAHAMLEFDRGESVQLRPVAEDDTEYTASLTAYEDVSFRVLLADKHQLENLAPARFRLRVIRDQPPSVSILQPGRRVTLKATDKLPVRFLARDDMAVKKAELLVTTGATDPVVVPIDLPDREDLRIEGETVVDLGRIDLTGLKHVTYRVRVADSLPSTLDNGPQTALSAEHEIVVDAGAQTFKMQVLKSVRREFAAALEEITKQLTSAKKQTDALKGDAAKELRFDVEQVKQTEAIREDLRRAEKLTADVGEMTAYTDYRLLGQRLANDIGQKHIAAAEHLFAQVSLLRREHEERRDRLGRASFEIQRAMEGIAELAKQFDDVALYQETAQALADAAAKQAELADRIQRLTEGDVEPGEGRNLPMPTSSASLAAASESGKSLAAFGGRPVTSATAQATSAPSATDGLETLTKEQQELIKATQEMISLHPELGRTAVEVPRDQSKTLLEQLAELRKRQEQLLGLAKEQQARDGAEGQREALAKAQDSLAQQLDQLTREQSELLQDAGAQPPDEQRAKSAAAKVRDERLDEAAGLMSQVFNELDRLARAAEARAKVLAKGLPDPKPDEQKSRLLGELAEQARRLAERQRELATVVQRTHQDRLTRQSKAAEAAGQLDRLIGELKQSLGEISKERDKFLDEIKKHGGLRSSLAEVVKHPVAINHVDKGGDGFQIRRLAKGAASLASAAAELEAAGKRITDAGQLARKRAKDHQAALATWAAEEANGVAATQAYDAEMARRAETARLWRLAETKRKGELAQWYARRHAAQKTSASQPSSRPVRSATRAATSSPAPPDALVTPLPEPKFQAIPRPSTTPPAKPKLQGPVWSEGDLKSADALADNAYRLSQRMKALEVRTSQASDRTKQLQDQSVALDKSAQEQGRALVGQQQAVQKEAIEVARQAARAEPLLKEFADSKGPAGVMAAAVQGIKQHDLPGVIKTQTVAAGRLEDLSKALRARAAQAQAAAAEVRKEVVRLQARAAAHQTLASRSVQVRDQQNELRKQVTALTRRLAPLGADLRDKIAADVLRRQQELAKEAAGLSDELATPQHADGFEMPARPDSDAQSAAMEARQAGEALAGLGSIATVSSAGPGKPENSPRITEVRGHQEKASRQLDRLVQRLQEPVEEDPTRWEQQAIERHMRILQAERASDLAERQRRLARELLSLASGAPMRAVGMEQEALAAKTRGYGQAAEFLAEQIDMMGPSLASLKPKLIESARKASELLEKAAPAAMKTAAMQLEQGVASQAVGPMTEAGRAVSDAHKLLGSLQAQVAKAAGKSTATAPSTEERNRRLTESLLDQYEALQRMLQAQQEATEGVTDPTEAAARAMREKLAARAAQAAASANVARMQASAREFMEAAWQAAGQENIDPTGAVVMPGLPTGQGNWRVVVPDSRILDFEMIGLSRSDWSRLPGTLREEVIQTAEDKAPPGYREIIKRYFKVISQRAGSGWDRPLIGEPSEQPRRQDPKSVGDPSRQK